MSRGIESIHVSNGRGDNQKLALTADNRWLLALAQERGLAETPLPGSKASVKTTEPSTILSAATLPPFAGQSRHDTGWRPACAPTSDG